MPARRGFLVYQLPGGQQKAVPPAPVPTFAQLIAIIDASYPTQREARLAAMRLLERARTLARPTDHKNRRWRRPPSFEEKKDLWQAEKIAAGEPLPDGRPMLKVEDLP